MDSANIIMPRMIDRIFVDLYNSLSVLWFLEEPLDPIMLSRRVTKNIEDVLGKNTIKRVFVRNFYLSKK